MTSTAAPQPGIPTGSASGQTATVALIVVLFASFMDLLDGTIVIVAGPSIASDLAASESQLQWMVAAYALALGAGLITGGRIGDQYGRRSVFLAGLAAFGLASIGCALAIGPEMLICTRVVQGLAGGLMVPQVFGIIRSSFDPDRMRKAFGAYGAVQGLAAVAGPLLGGLLVETDLLGLGWRAIFWVNVPIALVALAVGFRVLPESRAPRGSRLDLAGATMSSAAVVLVLLPLVQGREWGWPWWGYAMIATGALGFTLFIRYEAALARRGGQPVLDPGLLRIRSFVAGLSASVLVFGAIGAFFLTLSLYLQLGTGRSAWQTGLIILPYAVGSIITSGIGVALAARAGRALLITGSLTLAGSQAVLWFLVRDGQDPGYLPLAGALLVGGLGLGLTAPILLNVVLAGVPAEDSGTAGGVLSTVNQVGGAAGIAVLGTIFFAELAGANEGTSPQRFGDAFTVVLPIGTALYVLAAVLMLLLPRVTQTPARAATSGKDAP